LLLSLAIILRCLWNILLDSQLLDPSTPLLVLRQEITIGSSR